MMAKTPGLVHYAYRTYPPFLCTVKTIDMLPSSMVGHELGIKIKEFQHHCFHITLSLITGIRTEWPVDIVVCFQY